MFEAWVLLTRSLDMASGPSTQLLLCSAQVLEYQGSYTSINGLVAIAYLW